MRGLCLLAVAVVAARFTPDSSWVLPRAETKSLATTPCDPGPTVECGDRYSGGVNRGKASCVTFQGQVVTTEIICKLKEMFSSAAAEGVMLQLNSGFRTMSEQQALYKRNCRRGGRCRPATARPGTSNHQNGIAVDISTQTAPASYAWLRKRARFFGFIRAVASETWHWEFHPGKRCDSIVTRNKDGTRYSCVN